MISGIVRLREALTEARDLHVKIAAAHESYVPLLRGSVRLADEKLARILVEHPEVVDAFEAMLAWGEADLACASEWTSKNILARQQALAKLRDLAHSAAKER